MPRYYPKQADIELQLRDVSNDLARIIMKWGELPDDEIRERLSRDIATLFRARKKIDCGWVMD